MEKYDLIWFSNNSRSEWAGVHSLTVRLYLNFGWNSEVARSWQFNHFDNILSIWPASTLVYYQIFRVIGHIYMYIHIHILTASILKSSTMRDDTLDVISLLPPLLRSCAIWTNSCRDFPIRVFIWSSHFVWDLPVDFRPSTFPSTNINSLVPGILTIWLK